MHAMRGVGGVGGRLHHSHWVWEVGGQPAHRGRGAAVPEERREQGYVLGRRGGQLRAVGALGGLPGGGAAGAAAGGGDGGGGVLRGRWAGRRAVEPDGQRDTWGGGE
eukprot:scaffold24864_cov51-Isochrysis_galbana.AAC.1